LHKHLKLLHPSLKKALDGVAARFWSTASTPWDFRATTLQVLNGHRTRCARAVGWNDDNSCGCWQWYRRVSLGVYDLIEKGFFS
jgi:hypothetical protein